MARQAVQCRVWPSAAPMTRPAAPGCLMCSSRAARPCCCTDVLVDVSRLSSGLRGYGSRCLRRVCTTLLQYVSSFAHAADPRSSGFPWQGYAAAAERQCLQCSASSLRMARWSAPHLRTQVQRRRNEHDGGNAGTMEAVGEARDEEESSGQGGARGCGGGRRQGGSYNPERDSPLGVVRP